MSTLVGGRSPSPPSHRSAGLTALPTAFDARSTLVVARWPAMRAGAPRRNALVTLVTLASILVLTALFEWVLRFVVR